MNSDFLKKIKWAKNPFSAVRNWTDSSISHRIAAFAFAFTLMVTAAIGWKSYEVNKELVEENISRAMANEATLGARQVEFALNRLFDDISRVSSNTTIASSIEDPATRNSYLMHYFSTSKAPVHAAGMVAFYDTLGHPLTGTDAGAPSYDGAHWLKEVVGLGFTHVEFTKKSKAEQIIIASPVTASSTGQPNGMIVVRAPLADLFKKATSSLRNDLVKRLTDQRGVVLAEEGAKKLAEPVSAVQPVQPESSYFPYQLRLEILGEQSDVFAPLHRLAYSYAAAAVLIVFLAVWFSRKFGEHMVSDLARLNDAASAIAVNRAAGAPIPVTGRDEVAQLATAFNSMVERVNESHEDLENRVIERTTMLQDMNSALVKEILSHKQTGQQLHVAANAIENAAEGVMICNSDSRIISVNKAFTRITGYDNEEVLGRTPDMFISADNAASLRAEISDSIQEYGHWKGELKSHRKDGTAYVEERSVSAVKDEEGGTVNYIVLFSDVTKQKEDEERIHYLAHHDALTGLANRTLFQQHCDESLLRAHRKSGKVAVMFIDLDHFKAVNDSLGHAYGDELLESVAVRIQECVRKTDTVARFGGDEFAVLLNEVNDSGDVAFLCKKLLERLSASFTVAGHEIFVSASVGISFYPDDGQHAFILIKNADAAMYAAKEQGRNNYQFFSAEMNAQALEALMMASSLRLALDREELVLEYQPRIDLAAGKIMGAEALVRWNHPNLGRIMPGQFIGIAEKTGLINPLGDWVLRKACLQMVEWERSGALPLRIAVNLSARQFAQPDFTDRVAAIITETGVGADALELEVTESMVMHDPQRAAVILGRLKEMGVAVAIDDFGTGYSSLSYLKRFPIDYIKIDQSFVRGIPHEAEDVGIIRAIVALAKTLDVKLIAEGVDTEEQLAFLRKEGCDEGQGYLISTPLPAQALRIFIDGFVESAPLIKKVVETRPARMNG